MPEKVAHLLAERFVAFRNREEQLLAELIVYKSVLDISPCPMALASLDGLVTYVNQAFCKMLGVDILDVAADEWKKLVIGEDCERTIAEWQTVVSNKLKNFSSHTTLRGKNGVVPIVWHSTYLKDTGFAVTVLHPNCPFNSSIACMCSAKGTEVPSVA